MPQPNRERYGIEELYLFPYYQTNDGYAAAHGGQMPPPFDEKRRPKGWIDPSVDPDDPGAYIYDAVLQKKDGTWYVGKSAMPAAEAASFNILPGNEEGNFGLTDSQVQAQLYTKHWPVPVRPLLPNESIVSGFGGIPQVVRTDLLIANDKAEGKFSNEDRGMVSEALTLARKIAAKLGV